MTQTHWRAIAILGGFAIGFFMVTSFQNQSWAVSIYQSGASTGQQLGN